METIRSSLMQAIADEPAPDLNYMIRRHVQPIVGDPEAALLLANVADDDSLDVALAIAEATRDYEGSRYGYIAACYHARAVVIDQPLLCLGNHDGRTYYLPPGRSVVCVREGGKWNDVLGGFHDLDRPAAIRELARRGINL